MLLTSLVSSSASFAGQVRVAVIVVAGTFSGKELILVVVVVELFMA